MAELSSQDKVIAVMGPTGAGKSYFVQLATRDSSVKLGHGLESTTCNVSAHRLEINGEQVVLLDTPGFDDTHRTDGDILKTIADWLAERYVHGIKLTGILYLQRITDVRMQGSAVRNLAMFNKMIGGDAMRNLVFLTTMWSNVGDLDRAYDRERALRENYWNSMLVQGATMARFDGTKASSHGIIQSLLSRKAEVLILQKELIDDDLQLPETGAGKEVLASIQELKAVHQKQINDLRSLMTEALGQNNKANEEATLKAASLTRQLEDAQEQIDLLQSRNPDLEALQAQHQREMQNLKDSMEDRMRFLEEQATAPPPAYEEGISVRVEAPTITQRESRTLAVLSVLQHALFLAYQFLLKAVLYRRPPYGYRRLEWTCSCGERLHGVFKEIVPGSLDKLLETLQQRPAAISSPAGSSIRAQTNLNTPPKPLLRRSNHPINWNLPESGQGQPSDPANQVAGGGPIGPVVAMRHALQLCVQTGKYSLELGELEMDRPQSDGIVFQRIRERYEEMRYSILPMRFRFSRPNQVVYVKFRLSERPFVSPISGTVSAPSIPPESEVDAGNYIYSPCPIEYEPPVDNITFFHHFYAPASRHPDSVWSPRLPRKLGPSPAPMTPTWGIHLEEAPDWPLFAAVNCFALILSGVVAGIYSWRTGDHQTGVAVGTWLTAVQTLGVTAAFFWWT